MTAGRGEALQARKSKNARNLYFDSNFDIVTVLVEYYCYESQEMGKRKANRPLAKPRKRRFSGNQFTGGAVRTAGSENIPLFDQLQDYNDPSSLKIRKFSFVDSEEEDDDLQVVDEIEQCGDSKLEGSRIIDLQALADLISSSSVCVFCKKGSLSVSEVQRFGMAPELAITCDNCHHSTSKVLSRQTVVHKTVMHQVNRKAVLGMRVIGRGFKGLCTLSSILDLPPPMSKTTFHKHQRVVSSAVCDVGKASMAKAAAAVLEERQAEDHPADIAVSTDGTWMRRGYSSLYGVQTVLAWDTHQVVDVAILSKHCPQCKTWNAALLSGKKTQAEFDNWKEAHEGSCGINTKKSAPAMESEAVLQMWQRSVDVNNFRYVFYIGDGDSKGHVNVVEAKPYGDTTITKEECVGHVQKRLGKALRDLKQKHGGSCKLSDGKAIGGRGRLTDKLIDSLQNFYGKAVRENAGDWRSMSRAIWASFCHRGSSEDKHRHDFCPPGAGSWCGFQRLRAASGDANPPYVHHDSIPPAVFAAMKPVYERLTDPQLLQRCTRMATQNTNESLNGTIWHICPKESFCGPDTVEAAVYLAVATFNHGQVAIIPKVLRAMQCDAGPWTLMSLDMSDQERLYHSARKSSGKEKTARKKRRAVKKGFMDVAAEAEGVTYTPGGF